MGWYQLVGMMREAKSIEDMDRATPPKSCAVDYTALRGGPDGKLYCPWCGLIWPDDSSAWGEYPGSY